VAPFRGDASLQSIRSRLVLRRGSASREFYRRIRRRTWVQSRPGPGSVARCAIDRPPARLRTGRSRPVARRDRSGFGSNRPGVGSGSRCGPGWSPSPGRERWRRLRQKLVGELDFLGQQPEVLQVADEPEAAAGSSGDTIPNSLGEFRETGNQKRTGIAVGVRPADTPRARASTATGHNGKDDKWAVANDVWQGMSFEDRGDLSVETA
jgi:hypothetical protein